MSHESYPILCFPGFLGLPADFEILRNITPDLKVVDICGSDAPGESQTWPQWEKQLLESLNERYIGRKVVLVGYSMGARILLNILNKRIDWIQAVVLISCHPGLFDLEERKERLRSDLNWSTRFNYDTWTDLMSAWNSQASLRNSSPRVCSEFMFKRATLARVLDIFSLSKQTVNQNEKISVPTMICWGQKDEKFMTLSLSLRERFKFAHCHEVPDAGHRVFQDNPTHLVEIIKSFIAAY